MPSKVRSYEGKGVSTLLDWASGGGHVPGLLCHQRLLVVAFMSAENPGRPGPAPLWLPHSLSVASTQTTRCGTGGTGGPGGAGGAGGTRESLRPRGSTSAPPPTHTHTQDRYPALRGDMSLARHPNMSGATPTCIELP